jgi:hypothetical protein
MRVLVVGPALLGVSADVEASWADLVTRARALAEDRGDHAAFVRYRLDTGGSGSMPLDPDAPVTFRDLQELDAERLIGTIVSVLPGEPRTIWQDLMDRTPPVEDEDIEGMAEDERLRILEDLRTSAPHVDHERLAAGTLAGRATADRPDVPPWEYKRHVDQHPGTSMQELLRIRFPVVFAGCRGSTISSIAEDIDDHGHPEGALFTVAEALDRWQFLHDAGVVRWNSSTRAVEHVEGFGEVLVAQHAWATRWSAGGADEDGEGGAGRRGD